MTNNDVDYILQISNRQQLRQWLKDNYDKAKYCWIITTQVNEQKSLFNTINYLDAIEEALCFGWINETAKLISNTQLIQCLIPRNKRAWSELDKERYRRLEKLGLMTKAGKKTFFNANQKSFKVDKKIIKIIKSDPQVVKHIHSFPDLYLRIKLDNIQSKRKQPKLFHARLNKFMKNTRIGKMYGNWNDNGRLINY